MWEHWLRITGLEVKRPSPTNRQEGRGWLPHIHVAQQQDSRPPSNRHWGITPGVIISKVQQNLPCHPPSIETDSPDHLPSSPPWPARAGFPAPRLHIRGWRRQMALLMESIFVSPIAASSSVWRSTATRARKRSPPQTQLIGSRAFLPAEWQTTA